MPLFPQSNEPDTLLELVQHGMDNRDCVKCGTRLAGGEVECSACGASWPTLRMLDRRSDAPSVDEAVVWVLGAMLTIVTFFIVFVAW